MAMRTQFLHDNPLCAFCFREATELHHAAGRQGWRLLYGPWWRALCSACHSRVTTEPAWAVSVGLSLWRHGSTQTSNDGGPCE